MGYLPGRNPPQGSTMIRKALLLATLLGVTACMKITDRGVVKSAVCAGRYVQCRVELTTGAHVSVYGDVVMQGDEICVYGDSHCWELCR